MRSIPGLGSALVCLSLFSLLTVAVSRPAAAADSTLRYCQGEGDKASYDFSCSVHAKLDIQGGLTTSEADMTLKMKCLAEFLGADSDGNGKVRGQILSGTLQVKAEGEEENVPLDKLVINYRISPRGEMLESNLLSGEPPVLPGIWYIYVPDDTFLVGGVGVFPEGPVKVGDKWQGVAHIPSMVTGESQDVPYESKMLGEEQFRGRTCAKIRTTFKDTYKDALDVPGGQGEVNVEAKASGWRLWRFDRARGLVMQTEGNDNLNVTVVSTHPDVGTQTVRISGVLKVQSLLTEFKGQKTPGG